jgi:chromosome segregation ATPase
MSKDNRARPRIHRTDDKHDKALRAYATEHGIEPWRALEIAIQRLAWTDGPTIDTLRADLESAREATRRADAEIERITADWRAALAEVERVKALALERARTDATEIKRLREQYEAALDAVPSVAESRADQATITALRSELAEVRAALATKGADRLAERVETIASEVYAGFSDDFEAKLAERAPGWKGTLAELRARVITLGFSRYDALATDAAKRAAERGR